nr:unnamed protein product [Callosobruchus analis]
MNLVVLPLGSYFNKYHTCIFPSLCFGTVHMVRLIVPLYIISAFFGSFF